jgi:hypothetical protein
VAPQALLCDAGVRVRAWAELPDLDGRRRVEIGTFPTKWAAEQACERHAAALRAERGEETGIVKHSTGWR